MYAWFDSSGYDWRVVGGGRSEVSAVANSITGLRVVVAINMRHASEVLWDTC